MPGDKKDRMKDVTGTGALKDPKPWRYDLIPQEVIHRLAIHFGRGPICGYPARNWEQGQLFSTYYSSAQHHLGAFWQGENLDDDTSGTIMLPNGQQDFAHHLDAAIWQLVCLRAHTLNPGLVESAGLDDRPER